VAKLTNQLLRYKVMFTKGGTGGYTARVMLPKEAVKDLDIHAGDYIEYTRVPHGLLLRKVQKKGD
jgi:hypothetical protein